MTVFYFTIPFMLLAIAIATLPILWAMKREATLRDHEIVEQDNVQESPERLAA